MHSVNIHNSLLLHMIIFITIQCLLKGNPFNLVTTIKLDNNNATLRFINRYVTAGDLQF